MCWVYDHDEKNKDKPWEVGYFQPTGTWMAISYFETEEEAARTVHYLNGGNASPTAVIPLMKKK